MIDLSLFYFFFHCGSTKVQNRITTVCTHTLLSFLSVLANQHSNSTAQIARAVSTSSSTMLELWHDSNMREQKISVHPAQHACCMSVTLVDEFRMWSWVANQRLFVSTHCQG